MAQSAAVATDAPQSLGAPDAGFNDFLKSQYTPKIKQASADTQAAYGKAAGTIAAYKEAEQRLRPPAPPALQPPPQQQNSDPIQAWGSVAMAVATFGSLMTRRPLINSLNAASRVLDAYHAADDQAFNRTLADWHAQTDYAIQMHEYQTQLYQDALNKLRSGEQGALDELKIELGATGDQTNLAILEAQGPEAMQRNMDQHNLQVTRLKEASDKIMEHAPAVALSMELFKKYGPNPATWPPEAVKQLHDFAAAEKGAGATGGSTLEASKTLEILDKDDNVVRTVLGREGKGQAGWVDSASGQPLELKPGEHLREINPSAGSGGRTGGQVIRQQIGAREVLSDLQNAVSMPIGQTTGMFGGAVPGTSITEALKGDLVRKLTSQDAQLMQASMASMTRELSILMSPVYGGNWAAQQMDPLIPKEGDTVATTIFKLARLGQSADNALEGLVKAPMLSGEQKQFATDMRKQIQETIPWSPADALAFAHQGQEPKESFGDFVKSHRISGSGSASGGLPSGLPAGSKKVGTYQGHDVYQAPNGERYQVK